MTPDMGNASMVSNAVSLILSNRICTLGVYVIHCSYM